MDAAEDPDDAQLSWHSSLRKVSTHQQQAKDASSKDNGMLFDVYAEPADSQTSPPLPPSAQVFSLAGDGLSMGQHMQYTPCAHKKMQDDHYTLLPPSSSWHDVSQDDVVFTGFSFGASYDAMDSGGHAVYDSRDGLLKHSQCGPSDNGFYNHARAVLSDVFPDSDDEACNVDAEEISRESLPTQSGLLPQPTSGPVNDCLKSFTSLGHVLDDVVRHLKDSNSHEGPRTQCGPVPHAVPKVAATKCAMSTLSPLPLRGSGSPGTSPGGGMGGDDAALAALKDFKDPRSHADPRTQSGPMPHAGPKVADTRDDAALAAWKDFNSQISSSQSPIGGTQYGPWPHGHAYTDEASRTHADRDAQCPLTSRTQCGQLPLDDDHDLFPDGGSIFDSDLLLAFEESGQREPMPAFQNLGSLTSRTQCGPLPQQHSPRTPCDTLAGLQNTLKQLVDVSLDPRAALASRYVLLDAYAAATRQFELEYLEQGPSLAPAADDSTASICPQSQPSSRPPSSRTHCGPLPQQQTSVPLELGPPDFDLSVTQFEPLPQSSLQSIPSRTQSGPLPHELGPSPLQAAKDGTHEAETTRLKDFNSKAINCAPTPRTQCGPLPQQSMQTPLKGLKVRRGHRNGLNKDKGKGLMAKPLIPVNG